jgi:hypothetical protein
VVSEGAVKNLAAATKKTLSARCHPTFEIP